MRVFVTGATRGIGRAIAEAISARGGEHVLFLGCRDTQRGAALAATLSCGSVQVVSVELDVTKSATIAAAASAVAAACSVSSPLDALVNNAGVLLERDGCDLASIVEPTLSVNVAGVIAVTESFLPLLREGGRIINVSSGAGTRATASLDDADRASLDAATDVHSLQAAILRLAQAAAALPREPGDTPIYGLSKVGVNFYTRLVARQAQAAWLGHTGLAAVRPRHLRTTALTLMHNGPLGPAAALWPLGPRGTAPEPVRGAARHAGSWWYVRVAHATCADMPHEPPLDLQAAGLLVNACSPGFCRTEIAGPDVVYTARQPKDAALGADVVLKLLLGELGSGTGLFYKECSKPGTPLEAARSAVEAWW